MADNNPLLKALPPQTDYLSYLTILEYNLTKEQLPTLHGILQDTTLTANIGWDLVHILLPLLPDSEQCLHDVARLGNPREVVLKVTELLEGIAGNDGQDEFEVEDEGQDQEQEDENEKHAAEPIDLVKAPRKASPDAADTAANPPAKDVRFSALLSMLSILHPRIKTKYPSRFLSTSLQATLSAYSSLSESLLATESVLSLIKQISGISRPALPPRKSSATLSSIQFSQLEGSAPDPEANEDGLGAGEVDLQRRLLQSFLTYVAEAYLSSATDYEGDAPGMSWAARYQETMQPQKVVPGRQLLCELYTEEDNYHHKDATVGQILALSRDLGLKPDEIITTLLKTLEDDEREDKDETDILPSTSSDVPLSRTGALYILCATIVSPIIFHTSSTPLPELPDYTIFLNALIATPSHLSLGTETPAYLDALFFLGLYIFQTNSLITPSNDEEFNTALQRLSLLSAKISSPSQRYQAHQLASSLLHLHPSDDVKLAYIRDTLEHCPYETLKGSAVEWLKTEILSANASANESKSRLFSSPALLHLLAPWLWSDITLSNHTMDDYVIFQNLQSFYLAILNLLYLLLSSKILANNLGIYEFTKQIMAQFIAPLMEEARSFEAAFISGDLGEDESEEVRDARVAEMRLLMMNCAQVGDKIAAGL